jgi:hypothetical protein
VTSALGRDQNERRILTRTFDAVEEEFDHFDRFKSSSSNEPTQRRRRYTFQRLDHFFPFLSSFLVLPRLLARAIGKGDGPPILADWDTPFRTRDHSVGLPPNPPSIASTSARRRDAGAQ